MSTAAFAIALQVSALSDWKRPPWGAGAIVVGQQLGSQIDQEQKPTKGDILGMDELIQGKMTFRDLAAHAQFFFVRDRLAAITVKPQNPKTCSAVEENMRAAYGGSLMSRPSAEAHILFDVWDDPRTGDRITLQGTDPGGPAPFCTVTFVPPRRDQFNGHAGR